jgi:flagellar hook-basal body protein
VDGGVATPVTGLTVNSTVADLIAAINTVQGVTASLQGGQIRLTRDYAGDGAAYNITAASNAAAGNTNIVRRIFSNAAADQVAANNGLAHTFAVTDTFTPTGETALAPVSLGVETNESTGMVTGITNLGGGGVTIISSSQLAAGTAVIDTTDTQHATSITVFDSQGGKHTAVFTFTKRLTPNTWKWEVSTAGMEVLRSGWKGQVTFTNNGALGSFTFDDFSNSLIIDPNNGSAMMNVKLFPGTGGEHDGLTGFSAPFTAITKNQDGYGMGMLDKISIDEAGTITGIFTNGISRTLAQVILADFNNQGGLLKSGDTMFTASANSGDPIKGVAGATINAGISSGALESSNVDLAQEFTDVIVAQRGFQANARVISTSDQMLNELVNLKT